METHASSSPIFDRMRATSGVVIVDVDDDQQQVEDESGDDEP